MGLPRRSQRRRRGVSLLRIQSGDARGRRLRTLPKSTHVRPILARIKKSVFDIVRPYIKNISFLDMYAGTGSVGMEALSQGAGSAVFIEQDPACAKMIQENLKILNMDLSGRVYRLSATGDLSVLPKPFKIIFMGPPYKDQEKTPLALTEPTLLNIQKFNLLDPQGIVICQHHIKEIVPPLVEKLSLKREERYGDTLVGFYCFDEVQIFSKKRK